MRDTMHNKKLGWNAEALARKYYERQGWSFIAQNLTEKGSEIDLIMQKSLNYKAYTNISHENNKNIVNNEGSFNKETKLLFVEVKSVEIDNKDKLTPEDNFTKSKQRFLKRGIELYLTKNKLYNSDIEIRIDLACVYYHKKENKYTIKVYENIILE